MNPYAAYQVNIPEGQSGSWRIERFAVSEEESRLDALCGIVSGFGRYVPPGTYTRLMRGNTIIMTDTPDEIRDCLEPIRVARERVLVNGLGLGVVVYAMLRNPRVEHVTVVEISPDVIALVGQWFLREFGGRLTIIEADALTWKPPAGVRYTVAWHDIWDDICADNLEEMKLLHRRYGRRVDWQGSWCRYLCERQRGIGY
jgi:hypothetical protein